MASDLSLSFTSVPTPLGELTIVATDVGIVASGFPADRGSFLAQVEERLGGRAARAERALAAAREDARAYFAQSVRAFGVPADLRSAGTPFTRAVYEATIAVPYGELRTYSAEVGSTDLYAKAPQRFQIGVFRSSGQGVQLLTSGTIDIQITPFQGGPGTPLQGKAHYVGAPGTGADTGTPELTDPSTARGVYEFDGTFDTAGVWQANVGFQVEGEPVSLSTEFQVSDKPELPAPGQQAFRTKNLTVRSHVNPRSVDSRAQGGASIPDQDLHTDTIAGAIAAHR